VQHAAAYAPLKLRSGLVPVVQISTTLSQWVIFAGLGVMGFGGGNQTILLVGILLFAASTLFSLITLPVEYDASARALRWMESSGLTHRAEHEGAKDALKWAARTYLVAAISSIATLLYFVMIFMGRRD
jgi:Zn-dependent membrane protease YugP